MFERRLASTQVAAGRGMLGRRMLGIFQGGGFGVGVSVAGHRVVLAGGREGSHGDIEGSAIPGSR